MNKGRNNYIYRLYNHNSGAVLIEAAIAFPVLILLLLGMVTYGSWFMSAHSLQQAANQAARASLAGIDGDERKELVALSIGKSVLKDGTVHPDLVEVETSTDANYFTVSVSYDVERAGMFAHSIVPLPGKRIVREATVQLNTL